MLERARREEPVSLRCAGTVMDVQLSLLDGVPVAWKDLFDLARPK